MNTDNADHVIQEGKWKFDEKVTDVFENMLMRSIPQYDVMRKSVFDLACAYRQKASDIVDLGCSRGDAIAPLVDRFGATNGFVGIDVSEPMLEVSKQRFKGYIERGVVKIDNLDLREKYPEVRASVTLSILTLQFIPIEYRHRIVRDIYKSTLPLGAFIFVEKILGNTADINETLVKQYLNLKSNNGYSVEEIERKKLALEGVLVPVTSRWNEEMLSMAGFAQIDCFWRWMNFAGWIAIKE